MDDTIRVGLYLVFFTLVAESNGMLREILMATAVYYTRMLELGRADSPLVNGTVVL